MVGYGGGAGRGVRKGLLVVAAAGRVPSGRAVGIDLWQAEDQSGNRPEAKDDKPLFRAATNYFGNWNTALREAGLEFKVYRKWTKERAVDVLRQSYYGQSFNDVDPNLIAAAYQHFGGFYKAVEAAGLNLPHGKWSKRRIIDTILEY